MPDGTPEAALIVPTHLRVDLLIDCLTAIASQTITNLEIVVIDNASPLTISAIVRPRFPQVRVLRAPSNWFFARAINAGVVSSAAPIIGVLNDDAQMDERCVEEALTSLCQDQELGSVACKILQGRQPHLIDSAGTHLNISGQAGSVGWGEPNDERFSREEPVFAASAACAFYRRSSLLDVGLFDNAFVAFLEDTDLGFRLQLRGHRCVFNPRATAYHLGSATPRSRFRSSMLTERNMIWNLIKNMPSQLLKQHHRDIVAKQGQATQFIDGSDWRAWVCGKAWALVGLKRVLKQRATIQRSRRVSIDYIGQLLVSRSLTNFHM